MAPERKLAEEIKLKFPTKKNIQVLYECHVGEDDSSHDWFEHHVTSEGSACYSPNMPPEWSFCLATNAWAWVCLNFVFFS